MQVVEFARMKLKYRQKHEDPQPGIFGTYLGRGDGSITGPRLSGEITWDLYELQGPTACEMNLVGTISTEDGAAIRFDVLGFFKRIEDSPKWCLSSSVRFRAGDTRYGWLDNCVGWIDGVFDMASYTHDYRLFAHPCKA